jgi:acyl-CoA thioester hydrolase
MAEGDAAPPDLTDRASFKTWTSDKLRFNDTDMLGHVNNAVFATACETGRVTFLYDPEHPMAPEGTDFVVVRLVIDFRREMRYPGIIEIGTRILRVGRSSILMGQGIFKDGECVATAEGTCVLIDRARRKAVALPPELCERLAAL